MWEGREFPTVAAAQQHRLNVLTFRFLYAEDPIFKREWQHMISQAANAYDAEEMEYRFKLINIPLGYIAKKHRAYFINALREYDEI